LLEKSVGTVSLRLGTEAGDTGFAEGLDQGSELWPGVLASNEFKGLVLAEMSGERMIVLVLEDSESEVIGVGNVNAVIQSEETFGVGRPTRIRGGVKVFRGNRVGVKCRTDIGVELLDVHDDDSSEDGSSKTGGSEGSCQLFVRKNGTKIVWVYAGIVVAPLFRIDVPSSSQGVRFCSEASGTEANDEVEL
jgi:hypothetical protein